MYKHNYNDNLFFFTDNLLSTFTSLILHTYQLGKFIQWKIYINKYRTSLIGINLFTFKLKHKQQIELKDKSNITIKILSSNSLGNA